MWKVAIRKVVAMQTLEYIRASQITKDEWSNHAAEDEDEGDRYLSFERELETPDQGHRKTQYDNVGREIDAGCCHIQCRRKHTVCMRYLLVPCCCNWVTTKNIDESGGDF